MGRTKKPAAASSNTSPRPAHYDIDQIRTYARGQWVSILNLVGGIPLDVLDGQHHGCPMPGCGGTDRFRLIDADAGAILCNKCARTGIGDGFASLVWFTGKKFAEVLALVADYLGIAPDDRPGWRSNGRGGGDSRDTNDDPAKDLEFWEWDESNEIAAGYWCLTKPPITVAAIRAVGGRLARYQKKFVVVALPIWGPNLDADGAKPVGWLLYNKTGGNLERRIPPKERGGEWKTEYLKVKITRGSRPGILADLSRLKTATTIWKVEGPSDLLAMLSLASLPANVAAVSNAHGAGETPAGWMLELFAGRESFTCHDADEPGQRGAIGYVDPQSGRPHIGWAPAIASRATSSRNVVLPFAVEPTHGKDLRDYLNSDPQPAYSDLQALTDSAPLVDQPSPELLATIRGGEGEQGRAEGEQAANSKVADLEGIDNYHRLARLNLERYQRNTPNGMLRCWRNEWYKYDGFCYRKIEPEELKAKIGQAVREEFEKVAAKEFAEWDGEGEMPRIKQVSQSLVSNVLFATSQMCILSGTVELNTWTEGEFKDSDDRFVALRNGVLNIDRLLAGRDDYLLPHSPHWFSVTCLPFDFNIESECPRFRRFLQRNLENDAERISLLMEWAGYLLLPNTDYQKFMFFEGEGANGKSVFMAAIEAMIGEHNCSHVSLESFSKDFVLTQTLGKLVNIASECSEMDTVAEGLLKAVASGDRMTFNRKGIPPIEATPTARLMLSANVRPRFADKSSGLWRRMILMPWRVKIPEGDRTIGMDKIAWWERSGELAGIFNWALSGLDQLTTNKSFTRSKVCEAALDSYRKEMNSARSFLDEHYVEDAEYEMTTVEVYDTYKEWCIENGYRAVSDGSFGREVSRKFEKSTRDRRWGARDEMGRRKRYYVYVGIRAVKHEDDPEVTQQKQSEELFV